MIPLMSSAGEKTAQVLYAFKPLYWYSGSDVFFSSCYGEGEVPYSVARAKGTIQPQQSQRDTSCTTLPDGGWWKLDQSKSFKTSEAHAKKVKQ